MPEAKIYTASQVDRMFNQLVEQINQNNILLSSALAESQQNVKALVTIMKSALSPIGEGEDADMALSFARITAVLSQRVSLLEAKKVRRHANS